MATTTAEITARVAADREEREQAYRLRYEVYCEEMGIFRDGADHERRMLYDETDEGSDVLVAWAGGEAVGTGRVTCGAKRPFPAWMVEEWQLGRFLDLVPPERICVLTRFMVRRDFRGTMAPLEIMAAEVRLAVELGVELAFTDCEPHLLAMYTLLGFRPYCGTVNDENRDLHVPLVCLAHDRDHLERLNSPLLAWGLGSLEAEGGVATTAQVLERCDVRPPVERVEPALASRLVELDGSVLAGLEPDEVAGIVERSHVITLEPGGVLMRKGQTSRMVYVVLEGTLAAGEPARTAEPGDVVGEVAFLTGATRTMDVVAGPGGARVLTISERTLRKLVDSGSRAAAVLLLNIARTLARRMAGAPAAA